MDILNSRDYHLTIKLAKEEITIEVAQPNLAVIVKGLTETDESFFDKIKQQCHDMIIWEFQQGTFGDNKKTRYVLQPDLFTISVVVSPDHDSVYNARASNVRAYEGTITGYLHSYDFLALLHAKKRKT